MFQNKTMKKRINGFEEGKNTSEFWQSFTEKRISMADIFYLFIGIVIGIFLIDKIG